MRFGRSNNPEEATFDLTPMVDVVMLLIIFFTLTTHFAKTQLAPMDLPREPGVRVEKEDEQGAITVDLRTDGSMSVLGTNTDMPGLLSMVQAEMARGGAGVELIVRADRAAPARHLNRLANALASIGVRQWKLATAAEGGL
jgi:biopolymer transport protein ExbD